MPVDQRVSRAGAYLLACLPALLPFLCPRPPFQDWPANLGIVGALFHRDDPAARILEFYEFTGWVKPNILLHWIIYGLAHVFGPLLSSQLGLALVLGSLGVASVRLCEATGTDRRVALCAIPLSLGRLVYCGFAANELALAILLFALAAYFRFRRDGRRLDLAAVFFWFALLPLLHGFLLLAAVGLFLILLALDLTSSHRRAALRALGAPLVSLVLFQLAFRGQFQPAPGQPTAVSAVVDGILAQDRSNLLGAAWSWLFASYRYAHFDDGLQAAWLAFLLAGAVAAIWMEGRSFFFSERARLLLLAFVCLVVFAVLPENVGPPINWWGARNRLPSLAAVLILPTLGSALPARARKLTNVFLGLSVVTVLSFLADLWRYDRTEMAGFSEVLNEVPPGRRLTLLHFTPRDVHEYPGEPHGYTSNYYLLEKGGGVPQNLFDFGRKEMPFERKASLPAPPWGIGQGFTFAQHGRGYDAFIVRRDETRPEAPFRPGELLGLELVKASGHWAYYRPKAQ